MPSWKDNASFLAPRGITHKVQGEDVVFYAMPIRTAFKVRSFAEPLAEALAALFVDRDQDFGTSTKRVEDKEGVIQETVITPASLDVLKFRSEQTRGAYLRLIEAITHNEALMAEICMSSMRDLFPPGEPLPPANEFLGQVSLPALTDMAVGIVKANKGVLGPLAERLEEAILKAREKAMEQAEDRIKETLGPSSNQPSSKSSSEDTSESGS